MEQTAKSFGRMELAQLYFPLHPAALSLAEVEVTSRRRSRSPASNNAEAPLIPPVGSKYYLPTPRTPLKCPVLGAF